MKIPTKLKIGGHDFKIVQKKFTNPNQMGEMDCETNTISISESLPASQKEATLFHEILHAINTEWDNQINGHMILESISQQLYQIFKENKMLK